MFPAVVTLRGIEDYYEQHDGKTLFDDIRLPEGIDKSVLIPYILVRAGDFPVLIIDPEYIYNMTNTFFDAWYDNFDKLNKAFTQEYDPLENYNRTEEETHSDSGSRNTKTDTVNNTQSASASSGSSSGTNTNKISADNAEGFVNREQDTSTSSDNSSVSGSINNTGNMTEGEQKANAGQRKLHAFGNIGTLTNQMMLESEIKLRADFNIYDFISGKYIEQFCVPVYC